MLCWARLVGESSCISSRAWVTAYSNESMESEYEASKTASGVCVGRYLVSFTATVYPISVLKVYDIGIGEGYKGEREVV